MPISAQSPDLLVKVRHDVDNFLKLFFATQLQQAQSINYSYYTLWDVIKNLTMSGGKRYRPYLIVLAYLACGGNYDKRIIPIAVSQELLHISLLIHDDVIDRDFMRHGQDNVSGVFVKKYKAMGVNEADAIHYAHSAAILAGDIALSAAHQQVGLSEFTDTQKQQAMNLFAQGVFDVTAGELLDTEAALHSPLKVDSLQIARYKTASYSIVSPLCMGATLAGASKKVVDDLRECGINIGIGYQLADDMLGLFGDPAVTGKPNLSDLQEGKPTFIMQQILQRASKSDKQFVGSVFGNAKATTQDLNRVCIIATECGAKEFVQQKINNYAVDSCAALNKLPLRKQYAAELTKFIKLALQRQA